MCVKFSHISAAAVALMLVFLAAADAFSATVKGRVTDSESAAIKGAHVLFHLDISGKTQPQTNLDIFRETSVAGDFEVQLAPGFYDVCIMATAFTPVCSKILVAKGEETKHDVQLNADPLVTKHLGDQF